MVSRSYAMAYARTVMTNIRWGIRYGVIFAAIYCATALAIFAVGGSGAFRRYDITLGRTLASYVLGGVLGGAMLGLLRPLTRSAAGSACVGVFAALPVALTLAHVMGVGDLVAFSMRLTQALLSEEGTRGLADEPRIVLFAAPIASRPPRDRDLYASDGALQLARANGMHYIVQGVITRDELPPYCSLIIGLDGDASYGVHG